MRWASGALLSALFSGVITVLAKAGTRDIEPNLATAIHATMVLMLSWGIVRFKRKHGLEERLRPRHVVLDSIGSGDRIFVDVSFQSVASRRSVARAATS